MSKDAARNLLNIGGLVRRPPAQRINPPTNVGVELSQVLKRRELSGNRCGVTVGLAVE